MKRRKMWIVAGALLVFTVVCVGAATPAILEKASQLICLVQTAANPIPLSAFLRRLPTGEAVEYTLPLNTALVLTNLRWDFTATDTTLNGDFLFTVGKYYRFRVTMSNGYCWSTDSTTVGVPITDMSQTVKLSLFGDETQTPIPGTLSVRLVGFTSPNQ